jgi:hypothetical protein
MAGLLESAVPSSKQIRDQLKIMVRNELLGPAGGPDEEVSEMRMRDRYLVGAIAGKNSVVVPEEHDDLAVSGSDSVEEGASDSNLLTRATFFQSSFGLTFSLIDDSKPLRITVKWGEYDRVQSENIVDDKTGNPRQVWKRKQIEEVWEGVDSRHGKIGPHETYTTNWGSILIKGISRKVLKYRIVTVFVVNNQEEPRKLRDRAWLFQPELIVEAMDRSPIFQKRPQLELGGPELPSDPEDLSMNMLYRHQAEFAVGHGVSVHAEISPDDPLSAVKIRTSFIPEYVVSQQTPPDRQEIPKLESLTLDMKELSEIPEHDFPLHLKALPDAYEEWINRSDEEASRGLNGLSDHSQASREAIRNCREALSRIRQGIDLINHDGIAAEAFRFANRAMWLQRTRSILAQQVRRGEIPDQEAIDVPANRTWYPFQLAFILLNLPGLTDLNHEDRAEDTAAKIDLLWFPTGGGKTEAYLGLAAYVMGLRRLQKSVEDRDGQYGMAVLMRYTLRLLTLQQFHRASTLVCACEKIRREKKEQGDDRWGDEPFRIGLWVGGKVTPNYTKDSAESIIKDHGKSFGGSFGGTGSPAQLTYCPWCGTKIDSGKDIKVETYEKGRCRTLFYCADPNGVCPFTERNSGKEGIPVVVVDEEIYRLLPSMMISTVDKFAQMPWKGETQMLFGRVNGKCPRHGFRSPEIQDSDHHPPKQKHPSVTTEKSGLLRPPDLIIQDELHLISGPLGTLVGLYETAVDKLCSWQVNGKTVRPKVIASTATIRKSLDQAMSLFSRTVSIFPPSGLDAHDNFFSVQRKPSEDHPGRLYMGIMAPGIRLKAALIRVYTAFLSASQKLFNTYGEAADPWMTLVGYFNSIREMAGMRRLVDDDVAARLKSMELRGLANRKISEDGLEELTSRKSSKDIPSILDRMEIPFRHKDTASDKKIKTVAKKASEIIPLDLLLATNMVSVGVDVKRLGLMVVAGQPKTTAEYIQATSRVGRKHPGIVVTIYNWTRPRDLSHYETFEQYHATFYKHVEALSVTPFSPRALDRGLTALLVALIRLESDTFNSEEKAHQLDRNHHIVKSAVRAISDRSEKVTGKKDIGNEVKKMLDSRLDEWMNLIQTRKSAGSILAYRKGKSDASSPLLQKAEGGKWHIFTCLNSLREVETPLNLVLQTSEIQEKEWEEYPMSSDDLEADLND